MPPDHEGMPRPRPKIKFDEPTAAPQPAGTGPEAGAQTAGVNAPTDPDNKNTPPDPDSEKKDKVEKKVSPERQRHEVETIGELNIDRRQGALYKEIQGKEGDEKKAFAKEKQWVVSLEYAKNPGDPASFDDQPLTYVEKIGNQNPETVSITGVIGVGENGLLVCRGMRGKVGVPSIEISKEDFYKRMVLAQSEAILADLPEDQRPATKLYLDVLEKGDEAFAGMAPADIDTIINSGNDASGLLRSDRFETTLTRLILDEAERKRILEDLKLNEINTIDPETMGRVVAHTGLLGGTDIANYHKKLVADYDTARKGVDGTLSKPEKKAKEKALKAMRFEIAGLETIQSPIEIQKAFGEIYGPESPAELGKLMNDGIYSGNPETMVEVMYEYAKSKMNIEELMSKAKVKEVAGKLGKYAGFGGLLMMFLLYNATKSEGQAH